MVAQKGKDLLLKIYNGSAYETVGGSRTRSFPSTRNGDITDAESIGAARVGLAAPVSSDLARRLRLFKDQTSDELIRNTFFSGSILSCRSSSRISDRGPELPGDGARISGEHNGEVNFDTPGVCRCHHLRGL